MDRVAGDVGIDRPHFVQEFFHRFPFPDIDVGIHQQKILTVGTDEPVFQILRQVVLVHRVGMHGAFEVGDLVPVIDKQSLRKSLQEFRGGFGVGVL